MSKHRHKNMSNKEEKKENGTKAEDLNAKNVSDEETQKKDECQDANSEQETDSKAQNENTEENDHTTNSSEQTEDKDPLTEANRQIEELRDKYLRSVAEFDNYRKRTMKEKAELILNGSEKTVMAVLPVLDDMERALANADKAEDAKAIIEGMDLIFKKFVKALEGLGVKKIETEDKDFNTDFHEAIAMIPNCEDDKKGKVIDCVQTGYTLNDKVIRHAKVAVGQ
jgi:molecular chaperone GrpE